MSDKEDMSRFLPYNPDQAYLLPPSVKDVLEADHQPTQLREARRTSRAWMLKLWLVRVRAGDDEFAAAGAAGAGRLGTALFAGGGDPGLGAEQFPAAASALRQSQSAETRFSW